MHLIRRDRPWRGLVGPDCASRSRLRRLRRSLRCPSLFGTVDRPSMRAADPRPDPSGGCSGRSHDECSRSPYGAYRMASGPSLTGGCDARFRMVGCIDERSLGRRFGDVLGELGRSVLGWLERMRLRIADTGDCRIRRGTMGSGHRQTCRLGSAPVCLGRGGLSECSALVSPWCRGAAVWPRSRAGTAAGVHRRCGRRWWRAAADG